MAKRSRRVDRPKKPPRPQPRAGKSLFARIASGASSARAKIIGFAKRNRNLVGLLLLAAGLRLIWLNSQDLWVDEFYTYRGALALKLGDAFSELHWLSFLLYRAALDIHDSVFSLRFPSAALGSLTCIPFYLLIRTRLKKPHALFFTALLAVLPYHVQYSMEARYYTLVVFFFTVGLYFLAGFCLRGSPGSLILFFLFSSAACFCHPGAGGGVAGALAGAGIWIALSPRRWWRHATARFRCYSGRYGRLEMRVFLVLELLALSLIAVVGAYLAWQLVFRQVLTRWDRPLPRGISLSWRFVWSHFTRFGRGRWVVPELPVGNTVGAIALLGAVAVWWRDRFFAVLFTSLFVGGLGMLFLSRAEIPYVAKYSIAILPAFVGFLGVGLLEVGRWAAWAVRKRSAFAWACGAAALAMGLWGVALFRHYTGQIMPSREGFRRVAADSPPGPRPCLLVDGMITSSMFYYANATTPDLFLVNSYLHYWPAEALEGFLESLGQSRIPLWAACLRVDAPTLAPILKSGRWTQPFIIKALIDPYDLFLRRRLPESGVASKVGDRPDFGTRYEAEDFADIEPRWAGVVHSHGQKALVAVSLVSASYDIPWSGSSPANLRLVGRNAGPNSRLVEVRVNDVPVGVLHYVPHEEKFTTHTLVMPFPKKTNRLTFTVLDSTLAVNQEATYDKDRMELDCFYIQGVPQTNVQKVLFTDSILVSNPVATLKNPLELSRLSDPSRPDQLRRDWVIAPKDLVREILYDPDSPSKEALCLHIPKDMTGGGVMTQPLDVTPNWLIYGSVDIKTEHLNTHAVNVHVRFFDRSKKEIGGCFATNRALSGDQPWRRLTFLTNTPANAAALVIQVDVWRASAPGRLTGGNVWIRNPRMEWPPQKPSQN